MSTRGWFAVSEDCRIAEAFDEEDDRIGVRIQHRTCDGGPVSIRRIIEDGDLRSIVRRGSEDARAGEVDDVT